MVDQNDDPITPPVIIPDSNYHIQTRSTVTIRGYVTPYGLYSGSIPVRIKVDDGNTIRYLDVETNSDGYYSTEFTFNAVGLYTFTTYVGSDYSNSTTVYCYLGSLIEFTSLPAAFDNENYTLSGVLTYKGNTQNNVPIKIYEGQTLVDTVTTDGNGVFSKTFFNIAHGNHSFKAVFEGIDSGGVPIEGCDSTLNVDVYTPMILTLDGSELYNKVSGNPLIGNNMIIDYGDGTRVSYSGGDYDHYYASGVYTIKIGGVTSLGDDCFAACGDITSINIPDSVTSLGQYCFADCGALTINIPSSVTSIGAYCFDGCDALSKIIVDWTGNSIVTYNASWFDHHSISKFYIPMGTTNDYIAKGYPSNKLVERGFELTLSSNKDIIVTGETATLTATLTLDDTPVSGETVTMGVYKVSDDSLVETLTVVDNQDGTYTASYLGDGEGNLYIKADCMLLTQTYNIEDCIFYVNSVSSTTNYNVDLPSAFKVSAIINPASRSSATASVHIGTDSNNKMIIGQTASDGKLNLLKRLNGSYVNNYFNSLSEVNTDNYIECTYSNGVYSCKFNNETLTDNTGNITPSKLLTIETNSNITIKDIKIKPL